MVTMLITINIFIFLKIGNKNSAMGFFYVYSNGDFDMFCEALDFE